MDKVNTINILLMSKMNEFYKKIFYSDKPNIENKRCKLMLSCGLHDLTHSLTEIVNKKSSHIAVTA